ncbi:hypothetical protein LguiB_020854 [Lonicera macranthoides]
MAVRPSHFKLKHLTLSFILLFLTFFLLLNQTFRPKLGRNHISPTQSNSAEKSLRQSVKQNPRWYDFIFEEIKSDKIKFGLVNIDEKIGEFDNVKINFDRLDENLTWENFFPEWIDEDGKFGRLPVCPEIPMPQFEDYGELDVVVAKISCGTNREGVRDVFRLQVNLVVANLVVRNGYKESEEVDRTVYVVFVGSCGPMLEIFRCDDMIWDGGDQWIYKPDLRRLKEMVAMPVGTCQLAPPLPQPGEEARTRNSLQQKNIPINHPREAYVTVLHSSESYVCGAIALAQSILRTNSTKDLLLLADDSISPTSINGLKSAGWKIKKIQRIRSPHAKRNAYNEWNYSKLRIWQQTQYDKLIFIDSDLIVLKNIDAFFNYPALSAVRNDKFMFNSGVMLVEPSECMFKTMMKKRFALGSYNGGDQGFLNEVFVWWHRWPLTLNHLKVYNMRKRRHEVPNDLYTIHYLGLKPWMCYEDYDCNWDMEDHHIFASDSAHKKWWEIYKGMDEELKPYCELSKKMEEKLKKRRKRAKNGSWGDGHWKIKVKDPRRIKL